MMHDKFKKLLEKKRSSNMEHGMAPMSEHEKNAKMGVLQELHRQASEAMGHKLGGVKKVSVMSDSQGGLEAGLDKAKEIVNGASQAEHDPMKEAIHPDDIGNMAQDNDHDAARDNYSDPMEEGHSDMDDESEDEGSEMAPGEDHEDMDEDELNKKLEHLMSLKNKMASKKAGK